MEFVNGTASAFDRGRAATTGSQPTAAAARQGRAEWKVGGVPQQQPLTSTPTTTNAAGSSSRKYCLSDKLHDIPKLVVEEVDYDCTDGGDIHSTSEDDSPVMWIITEDKNLLFYPTTDPSHKPLNCVKLSEQAICLEYVKEVVGQKPRVFIGQSKSMISVYHHDEFRTNVWDIDNPEKITLPCANPNEQHDVMCLACVEDRIWVGVGPSIFFLNAEHPAMREGSIFLDNYRRRPEKILAINNVVVISTKGSIFYVFDSHSAKILQKFDVSPITHHLDLPIPLNLGSESHRVISAPTDIKTMVADGNLLYVGTSNGKLVTVPIRSLCAEVAQDWCIISQGSLEEKVEKEEEVVVAAMKSPKEGKKKGRRSKEPPRDSAEDKKGRRSKEPPHDGAEDKKGRRSKEPPHEGDEEKKGRRSKEPPHEDRKQKRSKEAKHSREEEKAGGGGARSPTDSKGSREQQPQQRGGGGGLSLREETKAREAALQEIKAHSLPRSAVAIHSHMDERVRDLLFLRLPEMKLSKLKQAAEMMQYHSLPNLASPHGGRIPISPPILSFRSLVLSVGKGHVEYVGEKGEDSGEDGSRHRERHEAFQLLVWGHKNLAAS